MAEMTDCHDWFAEVAETFVRYLVAKAGYEVFGQSEWGADLAVRDGVTKSWARCEVRSSDCKTEPLRKSSKKLAASAEMLANVTIQGTQFKVVFFKLTEQGYKAVVSRGGAAVAHTFETPAKLSNWLRDNIFPLSTNIVPIGTKAEPEV